MISVVVNPNLLVMGMESFKPNQTLKLDIYFGI
jgi:hypothetical protein